MDRGIKILTMMEELRTMPEFELVMQLEGFSVSIYTFDKNYLDLNKLFTFLANDPRADSLFLSRNRDQANHVMIDVIRLIHNYVAASLSLIDHTRRIYNKLYDTTDTFPDYQVKINSEFANDPLSQFVKCLRQYCQHYKAPNIVVETFWTGGMERATRSFFMLKSDLETFDKWSPTARKYLDEAKDKVDIWKVTNEYREKVISFYKWFQSQQEEIHKEEFQRFREKESRLLLLQLDDKIEISFAQSSQGIPHLKDEIFTLIFSSNEFDELESIPRDSIQRPERAIELLEQRFFSIPEEIKQKIFQLYRLPDISLE